MISSAQLAAMQATVNSSLDVTIQVKRATRTFDGTGHYSDSWANVGSAIKGSMAKPSGTLEQNYGYLVGPLDDWQVRVPVGTNILVNDRLVIGSQTLRVQVLLQPRSYQTGLLALATAIQPSEID